MSVEAGFLSDLLTRPLSLERRVSLEPLGLFVEKEPDCCQVLNVKELPLIHRQR